MAAFLPTDEVLPDEAVVVRGGVMESFDDVMESARDNFEETHRQSGGDLAIYGLSVCSLPDLTAHEIMYALPLDKRLPNKQVRQTTVEKLRRSGYDAVPSGWRGHATLKFPQLPAEDDWKRLQGVFAAREPNPYPKDK